MLYDDDEEEDEENSGMVRNLSMNQVFTSKFMLNFA